MPEQSGPQDGESSEDRFKKIRTELEAMKLPELGEDELEAKIPTELVKSRLPDVPEVHIGKSKAWEAKDRFDAQKRATEKSLRLDQESSRGLGVGIVVAYKILGFPMVGLLIGWLIDLFAKTFIFRSLGALTGFVIGIVVIMGELNRANRDK